MMLKKMVIGVLGLALCGLAMAMAWNLQPAASKLAADIHWLHEAVMVLVFVLFAGVFGFMFWSCYAHRKSVGRKAANFHQHLGVEIAWTAIPLIIFMIIAWPVTRTVIAQKDASNAGVTVKVISFVSTLSTSREQIK
jgi:cytochrome c oxidase subunit 2